MSTLTSRQRRVIHEILTIRKEVARRGVEPRGVGTSYTLN
nr:MAG TPA: hypothetical protein [Caudoviricetes sp.]